MKIQLRQVEVEKTIIVRNIITIPIEAFLQLLLKDLGMTFRFNREELSEIKNEKDLKKWIEKKKLEETYEGLTVDQIRTIEDVDNYFDPFYDQPKVINDTPNSEIEFVFKNFFDFEMELTLFRWLNFRRKKIMIDGIPLSEILSKASSITQTKTNEHPSIEMLNEDGQVLETNPLWD